MYSLGNEAEMANIHYNLEGGNSSYLAPEGYYAPATGVDNNLVKPLKHISKVSGALLSMTLLAGVSVWGYQLIIRDVSGIPVVRAIESEMRVRPEEPGGQLARNIGLAVNEVVGAGEASGPVDQIVLAPRPTELSEEDKPMVAAVQQVRTPDGANDSIPSALPPENLDGLAIVPPSDDLISTAIGQEIIAPIPASMTILAPTNISGASPVQSLRPQLRPKTAPSVVLLTNNTAMSDSTTEIDPSALPSGTHLVQLGAYKSEEIARLEWNKKVGRYGEYLQGKNRVIQKAQSSGRTFYRLRAQGFTDKIDTRLFCSALEVEGAECTPVVIR
jgi:hypothetical protein